MLEWKNLTFVLGHFTGSFLKGDDSIFRHSCFDAHLIIGPFYFYLVWKL